MKYMLMMSATKEVFAWYSKWPKEDLQKNFAFMHAISHYRSAAGKTGSLPERNYLLTQAARLSTPAVEAVKRKET